MQAGSAHTPLFSIPKRDANRTLIESARAMQFQAELPARLWGEAVHTATFLYNNSCRSDGNVPAEMIGLKTADPSLIRAYGCHAYSYIPANKKSEKLIMVEYSQNGNAYRLFAVEKNSVIISKHVKFDETKFFKDLSLKHNINMTSEGKWEKITYVAPSLEDNVYAHEEEEHIVSTNIDEDINLEDNSEHSVQLRRSERLATQDHINYKNLEANPERFPEFVSYAAQAQTYTSEDDPMYYKQAVNSDNANLWIEAMNKEINNLRKMGTWKLVDPPSDRKAIGCKWVYRKKESADGPIFKARLVAQGYNQKEGIDYEETYSPVCRYETVRAILCYAVQNDFMIGQMDVVGAYLNGNLSEEIYCDSPKATMKMLPKSAYLRKHFMDLSNLGMNGIKYLRMLY